VFAFRNLLKQKEIFLLPSKAEAVEEKHTKLSTFLLFFILTLGSGSSRSRREKQ
jgi:hypothetical protein